MESLAGIQAFVRVAETLSFVAAGRALGVSASAVGKAVAKLEQTLGTRLFNRTTRSVSLTAEGARFLERCRRILDDLRDAQAEVTQAARAPSGRLRVSLPTIGYRFFLPVLPEFQRRYPRVVLDLDFNDRLVDVVEEGFDAAIRSGELRDSRLMWRRLGPFRFVLCGAPAYFARKGMPRAPRDLARHDALRYRFPSNGKLQPWALGEDFARDGVLNATMTSNNMESIRLAAIAGLGLAYMPEFIVREAIAAGELQSVLDAHLTDVGQFSVLWPSREHLPARLRVFIDFVAEKLFRADGA